MSRPKLTYFDAPVSRGEECRLALHVAGIDFEDERLKSADWPARKPSTPFGSLPVFTVPGHAPVAQTNAILVLIGRRHGLHPKDDFVAAQHEAVMAHVEDLRGAMRPSMVAKDPAEKKRLREQLASEYLPTWAAQVERLIGEGPFFGGAALCVVDLKLYVTQRWIRSGALDHIPVDIWAGFPKLVRVHDAVAAHPRIQAWYAAGAKSAST
ncbi:MAG: glutathione S-transferase [Myxococcales bacterium]|nr:glutathione S-transferase [Myxococcales bacterium]